MDPFEIVVGVDYSATSTRALAMATDLLARQPAARLHAIAVAAGSGPRLPVELTADTKQRFLDEARDTLERFIDAHLETVSQAGKPVDRSRILDAVDFGDPAERILALAESLDADLIVVGTHGPRGMERLVLGSVAETVLRNAHCPVLVVREKSHAAR